MTTGATLRETFRFSGVCDVVSEQTTPILADSQMTSTCRVNPLKVKETGAGIAVT